MGHRIDELPSITTPSDSDKIVVEHDNLTSQITLARLIAAERARLNLLESKLEVIGAGSFNTVFANTLSITSQVDEFTVGSYTGTIASYGHQAATDVPADTNYYVEAFVYPNTNYRKIILHTLNSDASYTRYKYSDGTWGAWILNPTRNEITSINNSLANNSMTTMSVLSGRGTALDGGYCLVGNMVHINWKFKAGISATNSPSISSTPPSPKTEAALSCIDITSGISSAIDGSVPCGVSAVGTLYLKEIVNNHIYAITGTYIKL